MSGMGISLGSLEESTDCLFNIDENNTSNSTIEKVNKEIIQNTKFIPQGTEIKYDKQKAIEKFKLCKDTDIPVIKGNINLGFTGVNIIPESAKGSLIDPQFEDFDDIDFEETEDDTSFEDEFDDIDFEETEDSNDFDDIDFEETEDTLDSDNAEVSLDTESKPEQTSLDFSADFEETDDDASFDNDDTSFDGDTSFDADTSFDDNFDDSDFEETDDDTSFDDNFDDNDFEETDDDNSFDDNFDDNDFEETDDDNSFDDSDFEETDDDTSFDDSDFEETDDSSEFDNDFDAEVPDTQHTVFKEESETVNNQTGFKQSDIKAIEVTSAVSKEATEVDIKKKKEVPISDNRATQQLTKTPEKSVTSAVIKNNRHSSMQDNATNTTPKIKENIIDRDSNSVDKPKGHSTSEFDSLSETKLYELVKKYLLLKKVNQNLVDIGILNRQFGENNIKKLIKKSYLIKLGNKVTIARGSGR